MTVAVVKLGPKAGGDVRLWKYFSKFGYDTGRSTYTFRGRVLKPVPLLSETKISVEAYLDEEWALAEATEAYCDRKKISRRTSDLVIPAAGEWGTQIKGTVNQHIRPHVWFFAASDCNASLPNEAYQVEIEFETMQAGGSHFSVEQGWTFSASAVTLVGFTGFVCFFYRHCRIFRSTAGSVHPVIWTLAVVVLVQYVAMSLHTAHLLMFKSNGTGFRAMEVLSEILFMLAQILQTLLLITIALGYTLLQSKLSNLDIIIPLFLVVAVIHVALVGVSKLEDDAAHKFHEHEGITGWIVLTLRLALYAWFLWAAQSTATEGGHRLQSFLNHFRIAGSLYFLAYPVIFVAVKLFAPYWRPPIMTTGLMVTQITSSMWLSCLFLRRGGYFNVSTLSSSFLPGGNSSPTLRGKEE